MTAMLVGIAFWGAVIIGAVMTEKIESVFVRSQPPFLWFVVIKLLSVALACLIVFATGALIIML